MKKILIIFTLLIPTLGMPQSGSNKSAVSADNKITISFLQSFADAFNAHDIKAIMSSMTEDCIFEASAGDQIDGEKFSGREEVKKAFENVFATFPDAHWTNGHHFISGDRGFSEWVFTGTKTDGTRVEVTGCDLFTFKNGKIAIKNSYRKNRTIK
jgi:ketosteroid isomerase-like protein